MLAPVATEHSSSTVSFDHSCSRRNQQNWHICRMKKSLILRLSCRLRKGKEGLDTMLCLSKMIDSDHCN